MRGEGHRFAVLVAVVGAAAGHAMSGPAAAVEVTELREGAGRDLTVGRCIICHSGQGLATTFSGAGHTPKNEEQKKAWEKKYDWEPAMLEGSHDLVFRNSFKDIRYALETLNSTGARYEFECYDTSHLYNLHHFWTEGLVKAPLFIQTVFGLLGGIGAWMTHLIAEASQGSQVVLTPVGRLLGEPDFGPVSAAVLGTGEGLLFGIGLAIGLTRRPR